MNRGLMNIPAYDYHSKRLFITEVMDNRGAIIAVLPSVGTQGPTGAVQRSMKLRDILASRLGYAPKIQVNRYDSRYHDFLMEQIHLRIHWIINANSRRKENATELREGQRPELEGQATPGMDGGYRVAPIPEKRQLFWT